MRIARGDMVIGNWSVTEVRGRLEKGDLSLSDMFCDDDGDWQLLSELPSERAAGKVAKADTRPCYCGTGLPFRLCCGDGRNS